jgi:cephalosporin hydroxylase
VHSNWFEGFAVADEPKKISDITNVVTTLSPDDLLLTELGGGAGTAIITFANLAVAIAVAHDQLVDQLIVDTANLAAVTAAHADRIAALEGGV